MMLPELVANLTASITVCKIGNRYGKTKLPDRFELWQSTIGWTNDIEADSYATPRYVDGEISRASLHPRARSARD